MDLSVVETQDPKAAFYRDTGIIGYFLA